MQEQFLRLKEVVRLTGLKNATVYEHARTGRFPKPITISGTMTAWLNSEVQAWMDAQILASRSVPNDSVPLPP